MTTKADAQVSNTVTAQSNGPHNKRPTILIYPTVSPESVVIPIVSCILGFPLLALMIICCLRRRAKLARERDRRRNCDVEHGGRSQRAVSLRSERAMSRAFPSLELDTVVEERSDPEPEATVIEMMTPDKESDNSIGQTDNITASNTFILPASVKITDSDSDEADQIEPPSFVNKILENINKLKSTNDFETRPTKTSNRVSKKTDFDFDEECKNIGWTKEKKKGMDSIHTVTESVMKDLTKAEHILEKSIIKPGFERLHTVPTYDKNEKKLKAERKLEHDKTKGKKWYGLPATELTEEVKHDLEVLQMRSVLDPKHFYKKNDLKVLPKYFQVGKVMDTPLDYYNNRLTKKERKRTLVDELLADAEFNKYNKRRYAQITEENAKTHYKAYKQAKKLKRKNKK
ncbi:uncharacterized protein CBL_04705 [Carabus blaptoides fortunei]